MLEEFKKLNHNVSDLKHALYRIWETLPEETICKSFIIIIIIIIIVVYCELSNNAATEVRNGRFERC